MNLTDCPRIEDAAGYVLQALPEIESDSYGCHVAECEQCAAKVAELGFVSHALLSAVPQLSAPPEIRNRVMSVVRAESELLRAAGAGADRPPARQSRFGFARLRPLTAGALAAVLLALGLGSGALLRSGSESSCSTQAAVVEPGAGPDATAKLKVCGDSATLALAGMQSPPAGRIYQLWLDDPADRQGPKPTELFSVRNGEASVDVGDLRGHPKVLVTHEPSPSGSEIPSMQPIVKVVT